MVDITPLEFIKNIQDYYGQYPKAKVQFIAQYLNKFNNNYLAALFNAVLLRYSSSYGEKLPDIAVFESCKAEALSAMAKDNTARLLDAPEISEEERAQNARDIKAILDDLKSKASQKKASV